MTDPRPEEPAWWTDLASWSPTEPRPGTGRHANGRNPRAPLRPAPSPWTFLTGIAVGVPAGAIASSLWWLW